MRTVLSELYNFAISYIIFTDWQDIFTSLKILSGLISIVLILAILSLLFKIRKNIKKSLEIGMEAVADQGSAREITVDEKEWGAILEKMKSGNESDLKVALLEADNLFDNLIKRRGYQGEDMGERLKKIASEQLSNIEDVWWAHKIRNRIVHDANFHLERRQAQRAVGIYEQAMKNLGAL